MADIQNDLNKINNAIYGKDVRSSLANGLLIINAECESVDSKSKILAQTVTTSVLNMNHLKDNVDSKLEDMSNQSAENQEAMNSFNIWFNNIKNNSVTQLTTSIDGLKKEVKTITSTVLNNKSNLDINSNNISTLTTKQKNSMFIRDKGLTSDVFITINHANETGIYYTTQSSQISSMHDIPVAAAGVLETINAGCTNYMTGYEGMIYQRFTSFDNRVYTRVYNAKAQVWTTWTCLTPPRSAATGFAIQLNSLGKNVSNLNLNNNMLTTENEALGKQVSSLRLENKTLKSQVQSLATAMVQLQLNK